MINRISAALGFAALALTASSAGAGPYEWSGFYIGVHAGGATGDIDWTNVTEATGYIDLNTGDELGVSPDGVLGGGQLGYNFEFSGWLFGVEGSFAGMDFDDLADNPFAVGDEFITSEIEWLGTAGGRLGFVGGHTLFYGKGGWAVGEVDTYHEDYAGGRQGSYSTNETHNGWFGGVGIEHMIGPEVSVALEYNYVDLGKEEHSGTATAPFGGPVTNDIDVQLHTATARLNWHLFTP